VKHDAVNVLAMSTVTAPLLPTPGDEEQSATINEIDPSGEQLAVLPNLPDLIDQAVAPKSQPRCPKGTVCKPVEQQPVTSARRPRLFGRFLRRR
jgi:hypothetical protein